MASGAMLPGGRDFMCCILGIRSLANSHPASTEFMQDRLHHRDLEVSLHWPRGRVVLAYRHLSILVLSLAGRHAVAGRAGHWDLAIFQEGMARWVPETT